MATCTTLKTCTANYTGKCGTFDDGCGGQITCICGGDEVCDNNICRPPCLELGEKCGGTLNCCSENCASFKAYGNSNIAWDDQVGGAICCEKGYLLGPGDKCFQASNVTQSNFAVNASATGNLNDIYAAPITTGWADCDISEDIAKGPCKNVCTGGWIAGGEAGVGEYSTTSSQGCCGDDKQEYTIGGSRLLTTTTGKRCCNNATDCVDGEGNCVKIGTSENGRTCGECGWIQPNIDGTEYGCCPSPAMCLVDNEGNASKDWLDWYEVNWDTEIDPTLGPQCIYCSKFILDDRCTGISPSYWGSRTRMITFIMLQKSKQEGDDYVLFCDSYENSLNYVKHIVGNLEIEEAFLEKNGECGIYPCLGDQFCVLLDKTGNIRAVGGTLNPDLKEFNGNPQHHLEMLYNILEVTGANCPISTENQFKDCGKGLSYNPSMSAFIYVKEGSSSSPGIFGTISDFFSRLFRSLFGKYATIGLEDIKGLEEMYDNLLPDFNRFYAMKQGNREIFGIIESYDNVDRLMLNYTGFNTNICDATRSAVRASDANCTYSGGSYYIFANRIKDQEDPLFDNWVGLTASLRVQSCPHYERPDCPDGDIVSDEDENGCPIMRCVYHED